MSDDAETFDHAEFMNQYLCCARALNEALRSPVEFEALINQYLELVRARRYNRFTALAVARGIHSTICSYPTKIPLDISIHAIRHLYIEGLRNGVFIGNIFAAALGKSVHCARDAADQDLFLDELQGLEPKWTGWLQELVRFHLVDSRLFAAADAHKTQPREAAFSRFDHLFDTAEQLAAEFGEDIHEFPGMREIYRRLQFGDRPWPEHPDQFLSRLRAHVERGPDDFEYARLLLGALLERAPQGEMRKTPQGLAQFTEHLEEVADLYRTGRLCGYPRGSDGVLRECRDAVRTATLLGEDTLASRLRRVCRTLSKARRRAMEWTRALTPPGPPSSPGRSPCP